MKTFITIQVMLFLLLIINIVWANEKSQSDKVAKNSLSALIEEAVNNNPELKSSQELINIYRERPSQARSLDNPRVKLSLNNIPTDTFKFDQEPMTQKQLSVMQKLPYPGKLSLKGEIAEKEIEIVKNEYENRKLDIIKGVKVTYMDILFIDKAIEIIENNKELLSQFVKIAETKYSVGKGIQQDVLKAQVEISIMIDRLIELKQKKRSKVARLNSLLNRPAKTPFDHKGSLKKKDFKYTFENLKEIAIAIHPSLVRINDLIKRNQLKLRLAERNYYPDFDVSLGYGQRDERADFLSASVTANIPLWHKSKESGKVMEEKAGIRRARQQYNAALNSILFQIEDILANIEKEKQQIELLETGIIPQATLSLESAIAGYKVNKVDFITLVNNQITLFNYEIEYYRALSGYESKVAELEAVVGGEGGI